MSSPRFLLSSSFPLGCKSAIMLCLPLLAAAVAVAQQAAFVQQPSLSSGVMTTESGDSWIMRKEVNEVAVMFTARLRGQFVSDLQRNEIEVKEDRKAPGTIVDFRSEANLPLRLALLIDTSGSVDERFRYEQEAARKFLNHVLARSADQAFVMSFSQRTHVAQEFTADAASLSRAISRLQDDRGATAMFDAVSTACRKLLSYPDPDRIARVLVLVSDGDDNSSKIALEDALRQAQDAEVTVYTLSTSPMDWDPRANDNLRALAERTGGRVFFPESKREFAKAFTNIGDDLRNRYAIAYRPLHFAADGRFHRIRISARKFGKKLRIHARPGYFARADAGPPPTATP
jgi:Ca-activated chloride channel family protein